MAQTCLLQTANALQQARELLARFHGLPGLIRTSEQEITEVDGVGPASAACIKAALEFGQRLNLAAREDRPKVSSPSDLAVILLLEMTHLEREYFAVVSLDTRNQVLDKRTLYIGSLNTTHIRRAFGRWLVRTRVLATYHFHRRRGRTLIEWPKAVSKSGFSAVLDFDTSLSGALNWRTA
jgi:DNA repair protein RadC